MDTLSAMLAISLVERAPPRARERWQQAQLQNLAIFARERSDFWKKRLLSVQPGKPVRLCRLADSPARRRAPASRDRGPLLKTADGISLQSSSTSGSSGTPLTFFRSAVNKKYDITQALLQALETDQELTGNRTQFRATTKTTPKAFRSPRRIPGRSADWGVKNWLEQDHHYNSPDYSALKKELAKDQIGVMISNPWFAEVLLQYIEPSFLKKCGMKRWTPIGGTPDDELRKRFVDAGIEVLAHYSSREIGFMGTECRQFPSHYHIANSNVLIEVKHDEKLTIDGKACRRGAGHPSAFIRNAIHPLRKRGSGHISRTLPMRARRSCAFQHLWTAKAVAEAG